MSFVEASQVADLIGLENPIRLNLGGDKILPAHINVDDVTERAKNKPNFVMYMRELKRHEYF